MTDRPQRMELADYVRELTEPHTHVETYQTKSITGPGFIDARHITHVPSLLTQLWDNDVPSTAAETGPRPGFQSKPAARLDALDTAVRIDLEASRWVRDMGENDPSDTSDCIRLLHSLLRSADPVVRREVAHDVRRWWTQARIVTGWDSPAWTPDNTCPQCGERGTLKVRLIERLGMCVNDPCRATWDPSTIGVLAEHIRVESEEGRARRPGVGPCWCPFPMPKVPNLKVLCPRCGSARCRHAVTARLLADIRAQRHAGEDDVA